MTWNKETCYYDSVGRDWWIVAIACVKEMTILSVARYMVGAPNIYAIAVVDEEVPTVANILLDNGFTSIYDEEVDEQMRSKQKGMNGGERMTNGSNGYCPHEGMGRFRCDGCGGTEFTSYAQACPADRHRLWTYEYTCLGCGKVMGMDYKEVDE